MRAITPASTVALSDLAIIARALGSERAEFMEEAVAHEEQGHKLMQIAAKLKSEAEDLAKTTGDAQISVAQREEQLRVDRAKFTEEVQTTHAELKEQTRAADQRSREADAKVAAIEERERDVANRETQMDRRERELAAEIERVEKLEADLTARKNAMAALVAG
jgi:uncharacterized protein involved in exopolysaccharide biosynthesis